MEDKLGDYVDYMDFSNFPAYWHKKKWVPKWLWKLVAVKRFDNFNLDAFTEKRNLPINSGKQRQFFNYKEDGV